MSGRALALVAGVWLAGCHVDRTFPNARLRCTDSNDCPAGFTCETVPGLQAGPKVCCQGGNCTTPSPPGTGGAGMTGSGGVTGSTGDGATGSGGSVGGGGGGPDAASCSSECSPGMIRCENGGGRACKTDQPCAYWGPIDPKNVCSGLQLVDDGIEEADVSVQCAGNLCLIGGITP
jgi:hypothetical protein